ncbi:MAG TPA: SPOR domain-containing protein [Candidatus Macondimonas sp.]|nr:SPOR domain-containing protein [Candidatus Macondimonas sp.]
MDPILRRRLVGAAVLWAGAMVLVPWVLERKPASTESPALAAGGDPGREMRTIELAPPPLRETPPAPAQPSQRDPAEMLSAMAPASSMPEPPPREDEAAGEIPRQAELSTPPVRKAPPPPREAATTPRAPVPVAPPNPPVSPPAAAPRPAAPPERSNAPPAAPAKPASLTAPAPAPVAMAGWTVQVGSFGDLQNAQSLAARLVQRQHSAQVSTLVVDGRTLYRVRVGQLARREDAEALRLQIEQSMGLNGRVVPTP